jgi:hypothetical protein
MGFRNAFCLLGESEIEVFIGTKYLSGRVHCTYGVGGWCLFAPRGAGRWPEMARLQQKTKTKKQCYGCEKLKRKEKRLVMVKKGPETCMHP